MKVVTNNLELTSYQVISLQMHLISPPLAYQVVSQGTGRPSLYVIRRLRYVHQLSFHHGSSGSKTIRSYRRHEAPEGIQEEVGRQNVQRSCFSPCSIFD